MSQMIRCDKCHVTMYADSRSNKGDYCEIDIKYTDGYSVYHLCKVCHRQLMTEFMRGVKPEEYEEIYGEW